MHGDIQPPDDDFLFLGNHPAVDFANTVVMAGGKRRDLLGDLSAWQKWWVAAGLGEPAEGASEDVSLDEVHRLRRSIRRLLSAWNLEEPPEAEDLDEINRVLAWRRTVPTLQWRDDGYLWVSGEVPTSSRAALVALAEQTAALISEGDSRRLKACGGHDCILLFLDTSRNLSRRWCSMSACGNRSKVSRHYRRHHLTD